MSKANFLQRISQRLSLQAQPGRRLTRGTDTARAPAAERPLASNRHHVGIQYDNSPSTFTNGAAPQIVAATDQLAADIARDPWLRDLVDLSLWAFGDHEPATLMVDCCPAADFRMPGELPTACHTPLYSMYAAAVQHAIDRQTIVEEQFDGEVATTWSFVLSDFGANDLDARDRAFKARDLATENGVNVFLLMAGKRPYADVAAELAQPERPPIPITSVDDFRRFFGWLHTSLRQKSMSMPGTQLQLEEFNGVRLLGDA